MRVCLASVSRQLLSRLQSVLNAAARARLFFFGEEITAVA